jgi:hypothetical protein
MFLISIIVGNLGIELSGNNQNCLASFARLSLSRVNYVIQDKGLNLSDQRLDLVDEGVAHRLVGLDDRRHGPLRHDESELFLEPAQSLNRILDRLDGFLKDDPLRGMLKLLAVRRCASVQWPPLL